MSDFSLFSPGCCGCGGSGLTCFQVFGCCQKLQNATVQVYECATPGVTLASGTTDVNGMVCLDLSAHSGKTLCARASYPDDYDTEEIGLGTPLSAGYTFNLGPTSAAPGGISGRLTLSMVDCANTTVNITGKLIGAYRTSAPTTLLQSKTFTSSGVVVFDGLPVGESLFVGGLNFETFPSFTLDCEGSASARTTESGFCSQQWSFTAISCDEGPSRVCCDTCWPDTIPDTLCLNDPQGLWVATSSGYGSASCGAEEVDVTLEVASCTTFPALPWCSLTQSACGTPTTGWKYEGSGGFNAYGTAWTGPVTYYMWCDIDSGTMKLQALHAIGCYCTCCRHSGFTPDCADCQETWKPGGTAPTYSGVGFTVEATSVTCDPFTATFDFPAYTGDIEPCPRPCTAPCGSFTIDARTITVTEGPCP